MHLSSIRCGREPSGFVVPLACLLLLAIAAGTASGAAAPADPDETVANFLDRLGLDDLQVMHLEKVLQEPLPEDKQIRLARRLGDLYAGQLMDLAEDEQQSLAVLSRIQSLIKRVPQADTPALRVMLLQADYNHAETLAVQWIGNSADVEARGQATEILERITPDLNAFQRELNAQVDHLTDMLANLPEGDQRDAREQEFNRLQAVAGRATYFAGWANYYLGLMRADKEGNEIQLARETFRKLLDIRAEDYQTLDAEWLGLESVWRCRALIGLGLSEAALGRLDDSRACFSLLEHASVPPEMQDQAAFWYLQGLLNAGRYDEAVEYAAERVATYNARSSQGKVSVCVSLVRAAFGDRSIVPAGSRRRLGILGLEGLARLGQQRTVEQLMQQYQIELGDEGGFFLAWLAGRKQLAAAEQTRQDEDYRAAIRQLDSALAAPDADRQLSAAAQCRYELAWCWFQLRDYEQAGRLYQLAVTGLKSADLETAARAAWMAFVSYQKLADQQPRFASLAVDVLRTLKRDFPSHPYAKRADFFIDKMQRGTEAPEETIRRLEKIQPADPSYLAAQYDICLLWHGRWSQQDAAEAGESGRRVVAAARKYLEAAKQDRDEARKVKCCLLAAEVALASAGDDSATVAAAYLDQAAALVDRLPANDSLVADFHYRRMQLAGARKQEPQKLEEARWLVQHAAGSAYELPALVVVARAADDGVGRSTGEGRTTAQQNAFQVYQRLVQRLGTSPAVLQSSQNARVSLSRLADYAGQLRQYRDAALWLDALVDAFPTDRGFLRRSGLAHFHAEQFEASLNRWRALLAGLPNAAEGWYEAKYYQLLCLKQTDPATARKVLDQFQLLDPQLGPPAWRDKFRALIVDTP